jgi:hypothetical protein
MDSKDSVDTDETRTAAWAGRAFTKIENFAYMVLDSYLEDH